MNECQLDNSFMHLRNLRTQRTLSCEQEINQLKCKKLIFFLRGSVIPFPIGFCYKHVAILLQLLGIAVIISPRYH
jgi:hypothetical protein